MRKTQEGARKLRVVTRLTSSECCDINARALDLSGAPAFSLDSSLVSRTAWYDYTPLFLISAILNSPCRVSEFDVRSSSTSQYIRSETKRLMVLSRTYSPMSLQPW